MQFLICLNLGTLCISCFLCSSSSIQMLSGVRFNTSFSKRSLKKRTVLLMITFSRPLKKLRIM